MVGWIRLPPRELTLGWQVFSFLRLQTQLAFGERRPLVQNLSVVRTSLVDEWALGHPEYIAYLDGQEYIPDLPSD